MLTELVRKFNFNIAGVGFAAQRFEIVEFYLQ
jgi:hypothetical protein